MALSWVGTRDCQKGPFLTPRLTPFGPSSVACPATPLPGSKKRPPRAQIPSQYWYGPLWGKKGPFLQNPLATFLQLTRRNPVCKVNRAILGGFLGGGSGTPKPTPKRPLSDPQTTPFRPPETTLFDPPKRPFSDPENDPPKRPFSTPKLTSETDLFRPRIGPFFYMKRGSIFTQTRVIFLLKREVIF